LSKNLCQPWRIPELRYLKNGILRCAGPASRAQKLLESYAMQLLPSSLGVNGTAFAIAKAPSASRAASR
jgi:hypothetical protein